MDQIRTGSISRYSLHFANFLNAFYLRPGNMNQIRTFEDGK